jgi:hypothetical protein
MGSIILYLQAEPDKYQRYKYIIAKLLIDLNPPVLNGETYNEFGSHKAQKLKSDDWKRSAVSNKHHFTQKV